MRYKKLFLILAVLISPLKMMAEVIKDQAVLSYSYYIDNVGVEVLSPFISMQTRLSEYWGMNASFQLDAISAASMRQGGGKITDDVIADAVSGASGRGGFDDLRVAPTISFTYENGDYSWNFGMYYSNEIDYDSAAGFTEVASAFNEANTMLSFGGSYESATWTPIINRPLDTDSKIQGQVNASLTQLLNETSYLQARFSFILQKGFLASPYHNDIGSGQYDRYPEVRQSTAFSLLYVSTLSDSTSAHLNYRYYEDDWEITSHALEANFYYDMMDNLTLGARSRYYSQSAAFFVKGIGDYEVSDVYIVSDYKLTDFDTVTLGASLHYRPEFIEDESLAFQVSYDYYTTNENAYIFNWYGETTIIANMMTFSMSYDF